MADDALLDRVARLEQTSRRLRWLVAILAAYLLTTLVITLAPVVIPNIWPAWLLRGQHGQYIGLTAFGDTAVQVFWDTRKRRRLELGAASRGPIVALLGADQRPQASLWVGEADTPAFMLYNPDAADFSFKVDLMADDRPQLVLRHPASKGAIILGFTPEGQPILKLFDKEGTLVLLAPVQPADEGSE